MLNNSPFYTASLKDYIDVLLRRKWLYLVGLCVGFVIFLILQNMQKDLYESESHTFVVEKIRSSPQLQGFEGSSSFRSRWTLVQNLVFNDEVIGEHLPYFAGVQSYFKGKKKDIPALNDGTRDKDHILDRERYKTKRDIPRDLYHDQKVELSPYQWWMLEVLADKEGLRFKDPNNEDRVRRVEFFWRYVLGPMEANKAWPIVNEKLMRPTEMSGKKRDYRLLKEKGSNKDGLIRVKEYTEEEVKKIQSERTHFKLDGSIDATYALHPFISNTTFTRGDRKELQSEKFKANVKRAVARQPSPSGFIVRYEYNNPRMVQFVVAWTIEMIQRFSSKYQYDIIDATGGILRKQLDKSLLELDALEIEFLEKQEKYSNEYVTPLARTQSGDIGNNVIAQSYFAVNPQDYVRKRYNEVFEAKQRNQIRVKQIEKEIKLLSVKLGLEDPFLEKSSLVTRNEDYAKFRTQLLNLEAEKRVELYKKTPRHPHIVELDRKIASISKIITEINEYQKAETETIPNPEFIRIKKDREELERELLSVNVSLVELGLTEERLNKTIKSLPKIQQELDNLASSVTESHALVSRLQLSLNKTNSERELAYNLSSVEYNMKEPPSQPKQPPSRLYINIAVSFVLFIFVSVGLILAFEFTDPSIKELNDVNRFLDASVLGIIPVIEMEKENFTNEFRNKANGDGGA